MEILDLESRSAKTRKKNIFVETVKEVLFEWSENSSIHGVQKLTKSNFNWFMRILWFTLTITSFSFCCWNMSEESKSYFEFKTYFSIGIKRQIPLNFPKVTFCNINSLNTKKGFEYMEKAFEELNITLDKMSHNYERDLIDQYNFLIRGHIKSNKNLTNDSLKELSLDIEQMLISCYFNAEACDENDFDWFYHPKYGNCYRFKTIEKSTVKKVYNTGSTSGLRLELYLGVPDEDNLLSTSNGLFLKLDDHITKGLIPEDGMFLPTGLASYVGLKKVIHTKISKPFGEKCVKNLTDNTNLDSLISVTIEHNNIYSQKYCNKLCYQLMLAYKCSCYDPDYPDINMTNKVCDSLVALRCKNSLEKQLSKNATVYEACQVECPIECETVKYETSVSSTQYPTLNFGIYIKEVLEKQLNVSVFKEMNQHELLNNLMLQASTLQVNLYFDTMNVEMVNEEPVKTWFMFLSSVGGVLGLYMGASILSILEFTEIISLTFFKCKQKNKTK